MILVRGRHEAVASWMLELDELEVDIPIKLRLRRHNLRVLLHFGAECLYKFVLVDHVEESLHPRRTEVHRVLTATALGRRDFAKLTRKKLI